MEVGALFVDLEKFYEMVSHEVLAGESLAADFPQGLAHALFALYGGFRALQFGDANSQSFLTSGTILAGCSCATTMAKVLLWSTLSQLSKEHPSVRPTNVVDDNAFQCAGTVRHISKELGAVGREFVQHMRWLRLPLSIPKSVYTASSLALADALKDEWRSCPFKKVDDTRSLGTTATNGRIRRVGVQRTRQADAASRGARLLMLKDAGATRIDFAHRAGPTASALWGTPVAGLAPNALHGIRLGAIRAQGRLPKGASVGLRINSSPAARRFDPAAIHHGDVALQWALSVWAQQPSRRYWLRRSKEAGSLWKGRPRLGGSSRTRPWSTCSPWRGSGGESRRFGCWLTM